MIAAIGARLGPLGRALLPRMAILGILQPSSGLTTHNVDGIDAGAGRIADVVDQVWRVALIGHDALS